MNMIQSRTTLGSSILSGSPLLSTATSKGTPKTGSKSTIYNNFLWYKTYKEQAEL